MTNTFLMVTHRTGGKQEGGGAKSLIVGHIEKVLLDTRIKN